MQAAKPRSASTFVGVNEKGRVDPRDIKKSVTPQTTLVSVGLVNNETGTVQDIKAIAKVISDERQNRVKKGNPTPIYLHTDASQAVGILDINVARLGVDMMTLNGAKIYGPKQTGVLYLNSSIDLQPIIAGGGQERGLRSGTENVANIIGLGVAIEIAERKRKTEVERLQKIRLQMLDILLENFNDLIVIGDQKHHAPHILTVACPALDAERILFAL